MDDYKGYCEYAKLLTGLHAPKATKINQVKFYLIKNFPNYSNINRENGFGMKENMMNVMGKDKNLGFEQTDDVLGALNNQNFEIKKPPQNVFLGGGNNKKEKDVKKWLKRI